MRNQFVYQLKKTTGSTLILGLMIIVVIAFTVSTIAYVVLNALRSTEGYADSVRAYYAAQSGAERSLYYIEASRRSRQVGVSETVNVLNTLNATFSNGAEYQVNANEYNGPVLAQLDEGETIQLDIYNEEYTYGYRLVPLSQTDPVIIEVAWNEDCPVGEVSRLELSFVEWDPYLWTDFTSLSQFQNKYVIQCSSPMPDYACSYTGAALTPGFLYKVRIKAVNCAIPSVFVNPTVNAAPAATTNYIDISSQGAYGRSRIADNVRSLWRTPLIDYFDYVLFSEQDLIK